jgi:dUTP pyrophosphatase
VIQLKFKRLSPSAILPTYGSEGAAGFDFYVSEEAVSPSGKTIKVHTGWAVEVPKGYELQIRPRSGTSLKTGLMIKNSPGTIDSDYRGEVCILVYNTGERYGHCINRGDRIAQGVLKKVPEVEIVEVEDLSETKRGGGSFGSTGI